MKAVFVKQYSLTCNVANPPQTLPNVSITPKVITTSVKNPKTTQNQILNRQLNYSQTVPPVTNLGKKWMDYQGIKNWEGLLDPLDDNLRTEIIRYGQFVEAAYRSCDSNASCRFTQDQLLVRSGFPRTGYRVTRHLKATSGIRLPQPKNVPTSKWMAAQSSWIGYVAVCDCKKMISRLGRRDVVIAFRGTTTCLEWVQNLRTTLTPLPNNNTNNHSDDSDFDSNSGHCGPMVESGFLSLYTSRVGSCGQSLQDTIRQEISRILEMYNEQEQTLSLTITGHSLGAALAILAAYDLKQTFKNLPLVTVISFGGPRVGNRSLRCRLERQGIKILRIVNSDDLITKVPGLVIDNICSSHSKLTSTNNDKGGDGGGYMGNVWDWIRKVAEGNQWVYADVGCELKLSSYRRDSPNYLSGINNIATCHDLGTYLRLINGSV